MTIDWITVSAQVVNFLILVWLLKRFLYRPVIRAMDRREERISDRLNEAEAREQEADEKAQRFEQERTELERRREEILEEAKGEAERQRKALLEEARAEVAETRKHWQRQVEQEKEEFLGNLRHRAADAIRAIAGKVLGDLADSDLEERIVDRFIEQLKSLDKDTRRALAQTAHPVQIASAFELDSTVRGRLTRTVHEHVAEGLDVNYLRAPELLCGIELKSSGQRVSLSLADYLDELGTRIAESFEAVEPAAEKE